LARRWPSTLANWLERRDPFTKPQGLRKLGYRTWAAAESRVRNHIAPLIGQILLSELSREDVVWMLGELAEHGVGSPTLQKCRDHLVSALRQAMKERTWGVVHNAAAAVDAPADPDAPTADDWYTLTAPEAEAFLARLVGSEYESLYEVCLHLGLRQSEAFGLRWSDIEGCPAFVDTLMLGAQEAQKECPRAEDPIAIPRGVPRQRGQAAALVREEPFPNWLATSAVRPSRCAIGPSRLTATPADGRTA